MTIEELTQLKVNLRRNEGFRDTLYDDTKGVPTVGYGHNLRVPISNDAAELILSDDCNTWIGAVENAGIRRHVTKSAVFDATKN